MVLRGGAKKTLFWDQQIPKRKNQNNFKDVVPDVKAVEGNLVVFDYKATIDGKNFTGGEGKILN